MDSVIVLFDTDVPQESAIFTTKEKAHRIADYRMSFFLSGKDGTKEKAHRIADYRLFGLSLLCAFAVFLQVCLWAC